MSAPTPPGQGRQDRLRGLIAAVIGLVLAFSPWGLAIERGLGDGLFVLRGLVPSATWVVVVAIDEPSLAAIEHPWPWPRRLHAELLDQLYAAGARAVGFDLVFAEPQTPEDDAALADALVRHPTTRVAAERATVDRDGYRAEMAIGPWHLLPADAPQLGWINLPVDVDGVIRRLPLAPRPGTVPERTPSSLPALEGSALARTLAAAAGLDAAIPGTRIDFLGPPNSIPTVSYYQALDPRAHLPAGWFADAVVLVGIRAQTLVKADAGRADYFPVPFTRWGGHWMSGVEIHAQATAALLEGRSLRTLPWPLTVALATLLAALAARFLPDWRPALAGFALFVLGVAVFASALLGLTHAGWLWPMLPLLLPPAAVWLAGILSQYGRERRQRAFLLRAFRNYLAPSVIDALIRDPSVLRPGGKQVEATVLFLDLSGFTTLAEGMDAEALVALVNRFLGTAAAVVLRHEGMVDKFIGDAIMAVWGAALPQQDHAERACRAALEIQQALSALATEERSHSGLAVTARIGINSGVMIAGNIGGRERFDFTVLGDAVNLASRLEGANKSYDSQLLMGEETARRLGDTLPTREVDRIRVKGRAHPVRIFDLPTAANAEALIVAYAAALERYRQRDWEGAAAGFRHCQELAPDDGPIRRLLARCEDWSEDPPSTVSAADWDGSYGLTEK